MIYIDGLALVSKERFGATSSPGSQFTLPATDPGDASAFGAGSLAVVCQLVQGAGAASPGYVAPTGWSTLLTSITFTGGDGRGCRLGGWYKILNAGEPGLTYTAMSGAGRNRVCGMIMRFNRAIRDVEIVSAPTPSGSAALPNARTITWDSIATGAHLSVGFCHGEGIVSNVNYDWSVNPTDSAYLTTVTPGTDLGTADQTRTWYSFYPIGTNPSNNVMSMATDTGDFNVLAGALLRLT